MLRKKYAEDTKVQTLLNEEYAEIDLYRKYSYYYGYEFYIAQKI